MKYRVWAIGDEVRVVRWRRLRWWHRAAPRDGRILGCRYRYEALTAEGHWAPVPEGGIVPSPGQQATWPA